MTIEIFGVLDKKNKLSNILQFCTKDVNPYNSKVEKLENEEPNRNNKELDNLAIITKIKIIIKIELIVDIACNENEQPCESIPLNIYFLFLL